jgi:hypothetical protein
LGREFGRSGAPAFSTTELAECDCGWILFLWGQSIANCLLDHAKGVLCIV